VEGAAAEAAVAAETVSETGVAAENEGWMTEEGAGAAERRCRGSTTEGGLPLQWSTETEPLPATSTKVVTQHTKIISG